VRAVADHVVADLPRGEAFDCLDLYASRLPAKMVTTVLGLPVDERPLVCPAGSMRRTVV